jgi:hypothetical protein
MSWGFAVVAWFVARVNRAAAARKLADGRRGQAQSARVFARGAYVISCGLALLGVLLIVDGLARL